MREDLIDIDGKRQDAIGYFNLDANRKTVLILGGSLGSRRINQLAASTIAGFASEGVQVIWQCGKFYFEEYRHFSDMENIQVTAFIDRMDLVYAVADVIISRSGASSVSELCIVGKPVIFIPSPNVAEDHQTKNAKAITDKGGAILIRESELDAKFADQFKALLHDESLRQSLSENIKKLARANATKDIVDQIIKVMK